MSVLNLAKADVEPDDGANYMYRVQAVVAVVLTLYWGLHMFFTWKFDYWTDRGLPIVRPTAFIGSFGDLLLFRKSAGEFFRDLYLEHQYADAVGMWLFRKPVLLLRNNDLIKKVLIKDFNHFYDRTMHADPISDKLGAYNLFAVKNPAWRSIRAQLSPLFTGNKMRFLTKEMHSHSLHLNDRVKNEHVHKSKEAELKDLCALYTTDVIGSAAWGVDAGALASPETSHLRNIGRKIFTFNMKRALEMSLNFFAPEVAKMFSLKVFSAECSEDLSTIFWQVMDERERDLAAGKPTRSGDLIEALIQLKNNPPKDGVEYNSDTLAAQAASFFSAGFETSSSTLSFTLYELAFNNEMQERLHKEVFDAASGSTANLTNELVSKLPFLDICIKETLRKYPPLPFLDRMCVKTFTWIPEDPESKPITIEKGTHIYIPMLGIHMDPNYHKNPETWDPDRFSPERKSVSKILDYFPFGSGPRNCIGERFGLMQTKYGLASLMLTYKVSPAPGSVRPENLTIDKKALTFQAKEPLNIIFETRA